MNAAVPMMRDDSIGFRIFAGACDFCTHCNYPHDGYKRVCSLCWTHEHGGKPLTPYTRPADCEEWTFAGAQRVWDVAEYEQFGDYPFSSWRYVRTHNRWFENRGMSPPAHPTPSWLMECAK